MLQRTGVTFKVSGMLGTDCGVLEKHRTGKTVLSQQHGIYTQQQFPNRLLQVKSWSCQCWYRMQSPWSPVLGQTGTSISHALVSTSWCRAPASSLLKAPQQLFMPHQAMLVCLLRKETFQKAIVVVLSQCPFQSKHIFPMRQKQVR